MPGAMSRSLATKIMFFLMATFVAMVIWGVYNAASRKLDAMEEDARVHTAALGGVPILVPTPRGFTRIAPLPATIDDITVLLTFSGRRNGKDGSRFLALTQLDSFADAQLEPEDFEAMKEAILEYIGFEDEADSAAPVRIVENTEEALTLEIKGQLPVTDKPALATTAYESYSLVQAKLLRLTSVSIASGDQTPPDTLQPLREWRIAIQAANQPK